MKRRHSHPHDDNTGQGAAPAAEEIDRLYGLEPVIDVESAANEESEGAQNVVVACPYCGESFETRVDLTGGSFEYVEDCQICCQPITLKVEVGDAARLLSVTALQLNE